MLNDEFRTPLTLQYIYNKYIIIAPSINLLIALPIFN